MSVRIAPRNGASNEIPSAQGTPRPGTVKADGKIQTEQGTPRTRSAQIQFLFWFAVNTAKLVLSTGRAAVEQRQTETVVPWIVGAIVAVVALIVISRL